MGRHLAQGEYKVVKSGLMSCFLTKCSLRTFRGSLASHGNPLSVKMSIQPRVGLCGVSGVSKALHGLALE